MSLALRIGSVSAFLVVTLPTYWALSRLSLRTAAPTAWLRRVLITLVPLAGGGYLLFAFVGTDDAARGVVATLLSGFAPPAVQSTVADFAAQFALFLPTAGVILAAYAVVVPAVSHARGLELTTWTSVRRMSRFLAVFAVLSTILFVPFHRLVTGEDPGLTPLALVVLLLALPAVSPALFRLFRPIRTPHPDERERIESSRERAGLDVADSRILTDADETLAIHVRGLPGRRRLYCSEFALRGVDDETLCALLAVNAGSVEHHYRAIKLAPLFAFLVAGVSALAWGSPSSYAALIGLALSLPLPVLWAARRAVRRADEYAAATVGRETVADALERVATERNLDVQSGGLTTVFRSRPPLGERIDRLRSDER